MMSIATKIDSDAEMNKENILDALNIVNADKDNTINRTFLDAFKRALGSKI